jgi:hypothetical protein
MTEAEKRQTDRVAAMTEHLRPHAGSLEALWGAMPHAFLVAFGREINKADAHDLMLCHAALAPLDPEAG